MNIDGNQEKTCFVLCPFLQQSPTPRQWRCYQYIFPLRLLARITPAGWSKGEIQPVNLLSGQSKGKYLGSYKSKTVVQSLHREHTPTLTTHMASHYKSTYSWQIQLRNVPYTDRKDQTMPKGKFHLPPKRVTHLYIWWFSALCPTSRGQKISVGKIQRVPTLGTAGQVVSTQSTQSYCNMKAAQTIQKQMSPS